MGPTIIFETAKVTTAATLKRIQLGLVFIGLKSYPTNYPTNIPDSFIVAVGGGGYLGGTLGTGVATATGLPTAAGTGLLDGLITSASTTLDLKTYNGGSLTNNMGH